MCIFQTTKNSIRVICFEKDVSHYQYQKIATYETNDS